MPTIISPLSGARHFDNGFSIPPAVPDDFGEAMYDLRALLRGDRRFESEISEQIRKTVPELRARGQFVPWQVFNRGVGALLQRDMVAGAPTTGGSVIQTERLPDIADALRPVSQVVASGATVLTDLTNNISWPRWQLPSTPSAVAEIGPISSSGQTSSLLSLSAHRVSSMTTVSRQLLVQGSSMKLEELIKLEMLRSIGSIIDAYVLTGSGVSPYPLGILSMPKNTIGQRDVGKLQPAIALGGPASWTELVGFVGAVEGTDVADDGTMGWIVSPATKQKWSLSAKVATFPEFLYEDGKVGDHPLRASNNLSTTNQVIFARWSDVIIGLWPLSILTDPFALGTTANVRIFMDVFMDVGVLHGPAVCISADSGAQ
jgi:hypothetical protein